MKRIKRKERVCKKKEAKAKHLFVSVISGLASDTEEASEGSQAEIRNLEETGSESEKIYGIIDCLDESGCLIKLNLCVEECLKQRKEVSLESFEKCMVKIFSDVMKYRRSTVPEMSYHPSHNFS